MVWVGDVHGCYDLLIRLLGVIPKDKPIGFLGDMIDRGPQPMECLRKAFEVSDNVLMGNHEEMMLNSFFDDDKAVFAAQCWYNNGGEILIDKINDEGLIPEIMAMPFSVFIETDNVIACHAGIGFDVSDLDTKETIRNNLIAEHNLVVGGIKRSIPASYGDFLTTNHLWDTGTNNSIRCSKIMEKPVVMGHCIVDDPYVSENLIMIDTGGYYNGVLSAWDDDTGEVYSVSND